MQHHTALFAMSQSLLAHMSFPLSSCFPVIWVCHQYKGLFWWSAYFWLSSIHKMSYAQSEVGEYQRLSSGYASTVLCDIALGLLCSRIYAWCEDCEFILRQNCKGVLFKYTALYWLIGITESIPSTVNLKKKKPRFSIVLRSIFKNRILS